MNPLLEFDRRHSLSTTVVGSLSGLLSWIFAHASDVTQIAGMIGAVATAGIAVLTLIVKLCRISRNRDQRRRHWLTNPDDDLGD